jgi:inhibitor of KinA
MVDKREYWFHALGESSLVVSWGNVISRESNDKVTGLSKALQLQPFPGFVDAVPAYSSLTVLYNIVEVQKNLGSAKSCFEWVKNHVSDLIKNSVESITVDAYIIEIPVCYDEQLGNDLNAVSDTMQIDKTEIIALHTGKMYHVYMPGFLPGFAYMGEVDQRIAMPRKKAPVPVKKGAVGVAGLQTGIYPMVSPGGWHIVGYTPYELFNAASSDDPCLLHAGDTVQFKAICLDDYYAMQKQVSQ